MRNHLNNSLIILTLFNCLMNAACSINASIKDLNPASSLKPISPSVPVETSVELKIDDFADSAINLTLSGDIDSDISVSIVSGNTAPSDCTALSSEAINTSTKQVAVTGLNADTDYTVLLCKSSKIVSSTLVRTKTYCSMNNRTTNSPFANSGESNVDGLNEAGAFTICSPAQLNAIASVVANMNKYFKIKSDLDLSTLTSNSYQIIAATGNFTGTIDGQNHKIRNLTYNNNALDCVALVCRTLGATIKNLILENFNITGRDNVGALIANSNGGSITNVSSSGVINGRLSVGGLVGGNEADILSSSSSATVTLTSTTGVAGGLIGGHYAGTVTLSFATGNVSGNNTVGGLVGESYGGLISKSYAKGNVTSTVDIAGGLVGSLWSPIEKVYATGNVSGRDYVGGLVGDFASATGADCYATGGVSGRAWVGGLLGHFQNTSLTRSYASGTVTGTSQQIGGLIGYYQSGSVSHSFAIGNVSGVSASNYVGLIYGQYSAGTRTNLFYNSNATCVNSSGTCPAYGTAINLGSTPTYFQLSTNAPLNSWDFATVWKENAGALPTLRDF